MGCSYPDGDHSGWHNEPVPREEADVDVLNSQRFRCMRFGHYARDCSTPESKGWTKVLEATVAPMPAIALGAKFIASEMDRRVRRRQVVT